MRAEADQYSYNILENRMIRSLSTLIKRNRMKTESFCLLLEWKRALILYTVSESHCKCTQENCYCTWSNALSMSYQWKSRFQLHYCLARHNHPAEHFQHTCIAMILHASRHRLNISFAARCVSDIVYELGIDWKIIPLFLYDQAPGARGNILQGKLSLRQKISL